MKRSILLGLIFTAIAISTGCISAQGGQEPAVAVNMETVKELIEKQDRDYLLVDVRTPDEYESGHIPTAVNIPLSEIGGNPPTAEKDALILLYCRSGNRSGQALNTLTDMGYTNVYNVGGIIDWDGEVVR